MNENNNNVENKKSPLGGLGVVNNNNAENKKSPLGDLGVDNNKYAECKVPGIYPDFFIGRGFRGRGALLIICIILISYAPNYACTIGVASGRATADGRPLLWKTRDFEVKPNVVWYSETDQFNFISNVTPEYGLDKSWFGLNNKGFAIVNAFISDFPEGENGLGNGLFMNVALETCETVGDFIHLLDSTNITGRKTRTIFGVIDSTGGAAIFEVNANQYWKYDANNENTAPEGFIVRSNFTISNGGTGGMDRYRRSSVLINDFYQKNSLNVKNILQIQMRDMANADGTPISFTDKTSINEYFNSRGNICKYPTIAATVIQGVKGNEPAYLSTMWSMLGNPFTSVALPYWPVGSTPNVASSVSDSSLFSMSQRLKDYVFDNPQEQNQVNIYNARVLKKGMFEIEDSIYNQGVRLLNKWRKTPPPFAEMLMAEENFASYAANEMSATYSYVKKNNRFKGEQSHIIELDDFDDHFSSKGSRTISISLPPGYSCSNEKYRVIYFLDGERAFSPEGNQLNKMAANFYHDQLLKEDLIFPTIFVAIHNCGNRFKELTPTVANYQADGGQLEVFNQFITEVLKPYIDSNYRTLSEAEYTGIAGHSLGGLAAAYLAFTHPETYGMAGCMSSSFWWDKDYLMEKFAQPYHQQKPRLWLMSAEVTMPGMWTRTRLAAQLLLNNGWTEEDNLAYYHVYGGGHNTQACNAQMRDMLHFLLRKQKPYLLNTQIKSTNSAIEEAIDIESLGEYANVLLELNFTNGFRLNAIQPEQKIKNENIVAFNESCGCLSPKLAGQTSIEMRYKGHQSSVPIKSYDYSNYKKYPLEKTADKCIVDGKLDDWGTLKYRSMESKSDSNENFSFDLKYDDKFIYLAIKVDDDTVYVNNSYQSNKRDLIEVHFDARPDPERSLGRGLKKWENIIPIEVSPGETSADMILLRETFHRDRLPDDMQVVCINSDKGYITELKIPMEYIHTMQGEKWNAFRLNIYQSDIDSEQGEIIKQSWQPDWNGEDNVNGSGTFTHL